MLSRQRQIFQNANSAIPRRRSCFRLFRHSSIFVFSTHSMLTDFEWRLNPAPGPAGGSEMQGKMKKKLEGGGSPQLYYHDCSGRIPGLTTRAPPVGFELETNGFQFYAMPTWTT